MLLRLSAPTPTRCFALCAPALTLCLLRCAPASPLLQTTRRRWLSGSTSLRILLGSSTCGSEQATTGAVTIPTTGRADRKGRGGEQQAKPRPSRRPGEAASSKQRPRAPRSCLGVQQRIFWMAAVGS